jgi:acyl-CoA synthetase (AMP-forming)/AMP-acid ligase II
VTFTELLQLRADHDGHRPFMAYQDHEITWAHAVSVVARLATLLLSQGVREGDRVLLACGNSPTFIYGWFALRWIGACCVPLHTGATTDAVRTMIGDAEIKLAIADADLHITLTDAAPTVAAASLTYASFCDLERDVAPLDPAAFRCGAETEESSILYTSGTTGTPKGVVLSERSMTAGGGELARALEITPDDRIMLALPLFHTNPQVYGVMVALATGCSLAILPRLEPANFLAEAIRHRATGFTYVGTLLQLVLTATTDPVPPTPLRFCTGGGAPTAIWRQVEERLGVEVCELYGMTELGGWITVSTKADRKVGACGKVRPDMELAIVDDGDNVLPPGSRGQIVARPRRPHVMFEGYHQRPATTLAKLSNLWFHTGDLGELDDDGFLTFHGRADEMIRRAGENVQPTDIEDIITGLSGVREAVAVGVPDEIMGQEIKLVVVAEPGSGLSFDDVLEYARAKLPRFAQPRYVEILETDLPRTSTQKIVRAAVRHLHGHVHDVRATKTPTR